MDLSKLKPASGSVKSRKRLGRGEGSGYGDTASRGHKGAKSRSGFKHRWGFEGGQMPIYRRLPKYGFKNPNRTEYRKINLDNLQEIADNHKVDTITIDFLVEQKLAGKNDLVKILGRGELKSKLEVTAHAFSKSAQEAIEAKGGVATKIEG